MSTHTYTHSHARTHLKQYTHSCWSQMLPTPWSLSILDTDVSYKRAKDEANGIISGSCKQNKTKQESSDKFVSSQRCIGAWVLLSFDTLNQFILNSLAADPRGKSALAEMISQPQKPPVFLFFLKKTILSGGLVRK